MKTIDIIALVICAMIDGVGIGIAVSLYVLGL